MVPFAVEWVWLQVELGHLRGRYLDFGGIGYLCQFCLDLEPCSCSGAGNQIDDGLIADQRSCPPVLCDEGKHAVFDLVPLAGSRRKMRHLDMQAGEISQML